MPRTLDGGVLEERVRGVEAPHAPRPHLQGAVLQGQPVPRQAVLRRARGELGQAPDTHAVAEAALALDELGGVRQLLRAALEAQRAQHAGRGRRLHLSLIHI